MPVTHTFRFTKKQLRKRLVKQTINALLAAGVQVRIVHRKPGRSR